MMDDGVGRQLELCRAEEKWGSLWNLMSKTYLRLPSQSHLNLLQQHPSYAYHIGNEKCHISLEGLRTGT